MAKTSKFQGEKNTTDSCIYIFGIYSFLFSLGSAVGHVQGKPLRSYTKHQRAGLYGFKLRLHSTRPKYDAEIVMDICEWRPPAHQRNPIKAPS